MRTLTTDLEECREWIVVLECLAHRCRKLGKKESEDATTTLLSELTQEREDYKSRMIPIG